MTPLGKLARLAICIAWAAPATAQTVRDPAVPMRVPEGYVQERLLGQWFEVARSPSPMEPDCKAVTSEVETRDDSRLTLKLNCHKVSIVGPVIDIDGILVEHVPGVFVLRLVRLREFGAVTIAVLWQAEDDSLAVLGSPSGKIGWVWSKTADPDPAMLDMGIAKLVEAGYVAAEILTPDTAR
ncbi:lipocalin family protein [Mesobacterium pallidum]|uniref:lipocalin family protein n=1 Tax=Mesobacterium pallidum TaxID=2872037 RepID=UPI001EE2FD28|nr:lipocalin family protein [Mesobacterium pallidum]